MQNSVPTCMVALFTSSTKPVFTCRLTVQTFASLLYKRGYASETLCEEVTPSLEEFQKRLNLDPKVCDYINDLYSPRCCSLNSIPSRITSTTFATLNHIYTNAFYKLLLLEAVLLDVSDHLPIFCIIKNYATKKCAPKN